MPAARGSSDWPGSMDSRTGRRCTTFTQFPDEFSGGSHDMVAYSTTSVADQLVSSNGHRAGQTASLPVA